MEYTTLRIQITEIAQSRKITIKEAGAEKQIVILRKMLRLFETLPDDRVQGRTLYPMGSLVLMMFLATLAGTNCCTEVEDFWNGNPKLYRKLFGMTEIPSHDTFRRILGLIKADEFNALLVDVVRKADSGIRRALNLSVPKKKIVSVDGKQLRGTGRNMQDGEIRDLQILNFYEQDGETCTDSCSIEDKTNEIPVAQRELRAMNLKDTTVTFDALHSQTETVRIIAGNKGDYVGGLKGNHGKAKEFAERTFTEENMQKLRANEACYCMTSEISHNQLEQREFFFYPLTGSEKRGCFADWSKVWAIVCMKKSMTGNIDGRHAEEIRHYITSLKDVEETAHCIRAHWNIENSLHWLLDTVMMEDDLMLSDRNAALNQSLMNKACLSLYKKLSMLIGGKERISKKRLRKKFGWNFKGMCSQMLTLMDPLTLSRAIEIRDKTE